MKSSYIAIDSNILINFVGFLGWGGGGGRTENKTVKV